MAELTASDEDLNNNNFNNDSAIDNHNGNNSSISHADDKNLDDEYFETLDVDKLNIKNDHENHKDKVQVDIEPYIHSETKFTNRYTVSINDTISNYNDIDIKELTGESNINENEDDKYTSNDNPGINKFIQDAIEFGANALDLSKKNLIAIPKILFKLDSLQYLYLESNMLIELPTNFFKIFSQLKWLDLRNNQIVNLPLKGLANHENLRYLLLENNQMRKLPVEIAYIPNLTALNLLNNPLEFPPIDVVNKGIKYVKEYLKVNCNQQPDMELKIPKSVEPNILSVNDDLWPSDSDDDNDKRSPRHVTSTIKNRKSAKKVSVEIQTPLDKLPTKLLITQPLQPGNEANSDVKNRLNRAKSDANNLSANDPGDELSKIRLSVMKKRGVTLYEPKKKNEYGIYKNVELEKAIKNGQIDKYKKNKEKSDHQIEKMKEQAYVEDFRDEMKEQQRKLMYKRMVKGVDYEEPVRNAPFDIDEDYITIMTKDEREKLDERLLHEKMRSLSPETLWKIEEERRLRDHALQEKIREYTKKLLSKRDAPKGAPKKDRLDAAKDLRELRALEKELQQRQREIQFGANAYSGNLRYRETAKINNAAKAANFLPKKFN